ncbi:hypothetical protein KEM54_000770 [Ascosphaera aggregata]|nr:hypothetical protein KEM54_000770 [Ascosphaera aggregata]
MSTSREEDSAFKVNLASALLDPSKPSEPLESLQQGKDDGHARPNDETSWDLTEELSNGISFVPNAQNPTLHSGKIIGISWLHSTVPGVEEEHMRIWTHELSQYLLVTHIVSVSRMKYFDFKQPSAFVIQFYDSRQSTPSSLHPLVEERMPGFTPESIEAVTGTIRHYRALSFDDIVESVQRVIGTLEEDRERHGLDSGHFPPCLLILEGIDQSLREIQRSSSVLVAQAKLFPLIYKLINLSRSLSPKLSVLIVNSIGVPLSKQTTPLPPVLESMFSIEATALAMQESHKCYLSPFTKSMDQAIDTHLLISHEQENITVEVAKDRTGDGLGRWCIL